MGALVVLLLAMVVVGGLGLTGAAPASPAAGASPAAAHHTATAQATPAVVHGDLTVTSGEQYVIAPPELTQMYYQGGNITVDAGGTLIVRNTTISFVQSIPEYGTTAQRVLGLFSFDVLGSAYLFNSTITTDPWVLNAYPKLPLVVTGTMMLWNSSLAFPGSVTVTGATADLTLNNSNLTSNPQVANTSIALPHAIEADSIYAPTFTESAGARVELYHSSFDNTYADPTPPPLNASAGTGWGPNTPITAGNYSFPGFPNNEAGSASLAQAWLYPSGYSGGYVAAGYTSNGTGSGSAEVSLYFAGTTYVLGDMFFSPSQLNGLATIPITPAAIAAINAVGRDAFVTSVPSVKFSNLAIQPFVNITGLNISLIPDGLSYNITETGAGTVLGAVDTALDIDWVPTDIDPSPPAYQSNKFQVTDGAVAYLGNLTSPNPYSRTYSQSAVEPDNSSTVYLYRWAQFELTGQGGTLPIPDAAVSAFYAYPGGLNTTVNGVNDLATVDPSLWAYVQYATHLEGAPAYGSTARSGQTRLLLASSQLTGATLPAGTFLGNYHVHVLLPIAQNNSRDFNWSVSPYPEGVANDTPGYGTPDYAATAPFPQYYAEAGFEVSPTPSAHGGINSATGVRIGQNLTFTTTLISIGSAPITSMHAWLNWNDSTEIAWFNSTDVPLTAPGDNYTFNLTWHLNEAIIGDHGAPLNNTFNVTIVTNPGNVTGISGTLTASVAVLVLPSQVSVISQTPPPTSLNPNDAYLTTGHVDYNGTGTATIELWALPVGGGAPVFVATTPAKNDTSFALSWTPGPSVFAPGQLYVLQIRATYNGVTAFYNFTGTYGTPASTSPVSFLTQTILGLPLWVWLAIAAGVLIALLLFAVVLRRSAAGKLVECGECGNLIPEDATVCPKCGAEFETELVRCSRCASTIPAKSTICPECAALLLGTSAEAGEEAERQGYQDFTEKYRAEAKRELGENFNEGSFWDWWKRQPSYVPYNQWKLQQGQSTPRTGMTESPASDEDAGAPPAAPAGKQPPKGGSPPAAGAAAPPKSPPMAPKAAPAAPPAAPPPAAAAPAGAGGATAASGTAPTAGMKNCPGCGKEIPSDYLICPFCSSVVQ